MSTLHSTHTNHDWDSIWMKFSELVSDEGTLHPVLKGWAPNTVCWSLLLYNYSKTVLVKCFNILGSTLPLFPASAPFTQLIYKNISVPVYTTLKGVSTVLHVFYYYSSVLTISSFHFYVLAWQRWMLLAREQLSIVDVYFLESHSDQQHASPRWWLRLGGWQ